MLAILFLVLVPAPRPAVESFPIVGIWDVQGGWTQDMTFTPEGRYLSEKYGNGHWTASGPNEDGDMTIEFLEGQSWYIMVVSPDGKATGMSINGTCRVQITLTRRGK